MADRPRRSAAALPILVAMALVSPGGTGPAAAQDPSGAERPLFVAIDRDADLPYFRDQQAAFRSGIEELGGRATVHDARLDPALGMRLVQHALAAGATGIAITVPDQAIGPSVARAARSAGVALVATNDPIADETGALVPYVGFSDTELGAQAGAAAADLLTEAGWTGDASRRIGILSVEVQTSSACRDRTAASRGALLDAGVPVEWVVMASSTGEADSSRTASAAAVGAHPEVTDWVVVACDDLGAAGALDALGAAGVSADRVIAVGLGAGEACRAWTAAQPTGFRAALDISGRDVGTAAARVLWEHVVDGAPLPRSTIVTATLVDPETYAAAMDPASLAQCTG